MKSKQAPAANLLRPLLETYADSAIALVGCSATDIDRYSCELDVLVVGADRKPRASLKLGEVFADVYFPTEKDLLRPVNPERAMSLSALKPVRDTSLVLSTSSATSMAILSDAAAKSSRGRLASSLKTLGRAEAALAKQRLVEADFWLLAGTYEFGYAWLFSKETVPSPSHFLFQLRAISQGEPKKFEAFSAGVGLEAAGRAGCGARLEGATVLLDLLREGSKAATAESEWSEVRTEILDAKARELMTRIELAECYSFLGQDVVDSMLALLKQHPKKSVQSLSAGEGRLLSERLMRQLGIARSETAVRSALVLVKDQISLLAKSA